MNLTIAQINPIIGDLEYNQDKIEKAILKANNENSDLIIFPELCLVGYPPQDLLERKYFILAVEKAIKKIYNYSKNFPNLGILIGAPIRNNLEAGKNLYNAALLIQNGKIIFTQAKVLLPNYDVFDERRYFDTGKTIKVIPFKDQVLGISICEDAWNINPENQLHLYKKDPIEELKKLGATMIINLSASPFYLNKKEERLALFKSHAAKTGLPFIYVNQVGANDDLIFDGASLILNNQGEIVFQAKAFEEEVSTINFLQSKKFIVHKKNQMEELYQALVLGIKDYANKCGFKKLLLGLSGGIDSALTAVLAAKALGPENVMGISMPSPYSSTGSIEDSHILAKNLGIGFEVIPITKIMASFKEELDPFFKPSNQSCHCELVKQSSSLEKTPNLEIALGKAPKSPKGDFNLDQNRGTGCNKSLQEAPSSSGIAEENIQARIRGNLLMAFANQFNYLLLSTGNKSELAVGYCTLYGDMSGGLAVIADVPKTMVYELARFINQDQEIIPKIILTKPPSAELKPNQLDQDTLPEYDILDAIIHNYVDLGLSKEEIITKGFDLKTVQWVINAINKNEYKRRQAAPGLKVTSKAFGRGRRMMIAGRYS
ncbi:MAG: NAD(+) synthase [Candidatus Margulisiibacteriota bacterium]|jgi:NAD+ synthase (glutamine-hydrolysing)